MTPGGGGAYYTWRAERAEGEQESSACHTPDMRYAGYAVPGGMRWYAVLVCGARHRIGL